MIKPFYSLLFIFISFIFLTHYVFAGQAIYGDGIDYWAYLPSLYFDHDLDFTDQYTHTYSPENNNRFNSSHAPEIQKTHRTNIGRVDNPHPPGAALIWAPAFIAADGFSALFHLPRTGYADLYQITVSLFTLILVIVALMLNQLLAHAFVKDNRLSRLTVIATLFATPLLYYGSYDVLNSHGPSFLLTSLFWCLLFVPRFQNYQRPMVIGLIIGLATLIRLQDALLLIPAIVLFNRRSADKARAMVELFLSWLICLTPLFIVWYSLYGLPLPLSYLAKGHIYRGVLGPLFHRTNGLFFRTPFLFISLLGFKPLFSRFKPQALYLISFLLPTFIIVVYQGGWRDAAYGGRMFLSALPIFTILIALALRQLQNRFSFRFATILVIVFSLLNLISITSFVLFEKQVNSGRKTGLEEHTLLKLEQLFHHHFPD